MLVQAGQNEKGTRQIHTGGILTYAEACVSDNS
jgi:hypothetical protein